MLTGKQMEIGYSTRYLVLLILLESTFCVKFTVKEQESAGTFVGQINGLDAGGSYCVTSSCGWSSLFALDKRSGVINTTTVIDREQLSSSIITMTLSGSDSNQNNYLEVIEVEIEDINDNNPTFSASEHTILVSEELGPQVFDLLSWNDRDTGANGMLKKVQILNLPDQSWPFIPEIKTSGNFQQVVLKVTQSLDRETVGRYEFTVEIEDNGYPALTGTLDIIIDVQDINDNAPAFEKDSYAFDVYENVNIPFEIYQFVATDADSDDNGKIQYSLTHGYSKPYFAIGQFSGQLSLIADVDYESCPRLRSGVKGVTLVVSARDMGLSPRYRTAAVDIIVHDVNDNSPTINFYSPFMTRPNSDIVELQENIAVNSYTATIIISDKDSGANGEYDVSIDSGDFGRFKLETSNGLLMLTAGHLDREHTPSYDIVISATDKGIPPLKSTKTLTVNILDVNDNSPTFTKPLYSQSVPEDSPVDTFIISVKALDLDNGVNGSVVYRIVSQTGGDFFKISSRGSISNLRVLDAESVKYHVLNISASDEGNPSLASYTTVNITVSDVNDNFPIFEKAQYSCDVLESTTPNSIICSVTATDLDGGLNGKIVYSIIQSDNDFFSIDSSNGNVQITSMLDYEASTVHHITVKVADKGSPPKYTTCEMVINILDANDETPRFNPTTYSASIPEGVIYSSILQVHALDDDKDDTISFSLVSSDQNFAVSATGVISNTRKLQYLPSSSTYNFQISAHDSAGNVAVQPASIGVTVLQNSDDLPVFPQGIIKTSVSEDAVVGHIVTTVSASSQSGCSLSYSFDSVSIYFTLESSTGKLKIKKMIDYETVKRISVNIVASCGLVTGHAIVEIDVIDANDNTPVCTSGAEAYVQEDTPVRTVIYTCVCSDLDSGLNGKLTYSLSLASPLLSIVTSSGELTVASQLDRETQSTISLTINVCDMGKDLSLCSSKDFTVHITDVNDNDPQFLDPLTFYVKEDVKLNHAVGNLAASDKDEGKNSKLTFTVINSVPEIKVFSSGQMVVDEHLDFETIDRFFLNVRVTDQGIPPLSNEAIVTIIVQDANDNRPEFEQTSYTFTVNEDQSAPYTIGSVSASDKDADNNGKVIFSLLDSTQVFAINITTGELTLIGELDFESSIALYNIQVQAADLGETSLKSQVTVTIDVIDVNDNAPVFSQDTYSVPLPEDTAINSHIFDVSASDRDGPMNNQITYSFVNQQVKFRIDTTSGGIFITGVLDFEIEQSYNISVKAQDSGSPALFSIAHVLIILSDVNDNVPSFETSVLEIGIVESTSPGTIIKKIQASDNDSGNNGKITYSITFESDEGYFSLDSYSGDLMLLKKLTFSGKVYKLNVTATDHGTVQLSSSQAVKIIVIDVNDNTPVFTDGISVASVVENSPIGTTVFQVSATDKDSGPAGMVNYNISSEFFSIDKRNGKVAVSLNIDREEHSVLVASVCATDQASPVSEQLSVCKDVSVNVLDINDNAPIFVSQDTDIFVHEKTKVKENITRIEVSDADYQSNAIVTFTIIDQVPNGIVSIDAGTGDIFLAKSVDFEDSPDACSFSIVISDQGNPILQNLKNFKLIVIDDNDNLPVFVNPMAQRSVYLSSSVEAGSIIFKAYATDADSGTNGKITYSLPTSAGDKFSINKESGEIQIKVDVDSAFVNVLITVKATDSGNPSLSSTMVVNIEFHTENTKPVCPGKSRVTVSEDEFSYSPLYTIQCYDLDWSDIGLLKYSIINGNIGEVFSVSNGGEITLTQHRLDYEELNFYSLVILVEDIGKPSLKELFILEVTVTNVNDEIPRFSADELVLTLSEGTAVGALVETVTASDADGDLVSYSYTTTTEACKGYFDLNSQTGQLTLSKEVDDALIQSTQLCEVSVTASDGVYSSDVLLSVVITDIDNSWPIFYSSSQFTINLASSSVVGAVGATDKDIGDSNLVYMIPKTRPSPGFVVDPETGVISCPDLTCLTSDVQVKASGRTLSETKTVSITIGSSSVQQVFSEPHYSFSVKELATIGFIIGRINVENSPDQLTIEGGNNGLSFRVYNLNLIVNNKLDFEIWSAFNLTLCATLGSVSTFASIYVTVEDVNDNAPLFLPASIIREVQGNALVGTTVYQVQAEDADSGLSGQLLYYLEDSIFNDYFSIETTSGIIKVKKALKHAPLSMDIQVKSKDQGSPVLTSKTFNLIIEVVYQASAPQFKKPSFDFTAFADASAHTYIGQIEVLDSEHDEYRFAFEKESLYFTIYSVSGKILQKSSISDNKLLKVRETIQVVSAYDSKLSGTVMAEIRIIQSICLPNPCLNGGICIDSIESYECKCLPRTAGKKCDCIDSECSNHGFCAYNASMGKTTCLCEDGKYRENCIMSDSMLMFAVIAGGAFVVIVIFVSVTVYCIVRHRRSKSKKAAKQDFEHAVNGTRLDSNKRLKGQLHLQDICLNPINVSNLDVDSKIGYPGFNYTNHDYDLDSPLPMQSPSQFTPRSFQYAASDSGHSSQCTEAIIFRKLKQVDEPNSVESQRKDKDSGLAGSLNTLCHFDMDYNNETQDYLVDWGPKVQNLVNVLDLDVIILDEDTPIKEEFV